MTRLTEALKRAAEAPSLPAEANDTDNNVPLAEWRFAPVETMHVPDEPPAAAAVAVAAPPVDFVEPDAAPSIPVPKAEPAARRLNRAASPALRLDAADRGKMVVGENVDAALVEEYRHLAAALHHAQKASGVRAVMITSALPSEGKTLTATNLALTLSESYQRRVLLIDADLRRPRMREMFSLPASDGLTHVLSATQAGRLPVHQLTQHLWVLTAGHVRPDPMSLLVSPAMKQLVDDARESFDWVIIDTPPIAILPDANLLSKMVDTTLLVVSAQKTPYPMVQRAADALGPQRILGVVLNRAERTASGGYGYYGYQGRESNPPRRNWFGWLRRSKSNPNVS